jgi:hypothetical protein
LAQISVQINSADASTCDAPWARAAATNKNQYSQLLHLYNSGEAIIVRTEPDRGWFEQVSVYSKSIRIEYVRATPQPRGID